MAQLKHINAQGEEVAADSPDAAYQVNPTDSQGDKFIESIKNKAAREGLAPSSAITSALSVETDGHGSSPLDGIDKRALKSLQDAGIDTMDKIAGASDEELKALPYVTEKVLAQLREVTSPRRAVLAPAPAPV